MEPDGEHIVQGSHDGFVESMDVNIALIRKRLTIPNLVVRKVVISSFSKSSICYMYIESKVDQVTLDELDIRLRKIDTEYLISAGHLADFLEEPFGHLSHN